MCIVSIKCAINVNVVYVVTYDVSRYTYVAISPWHDYDIGNFILWHPIHKSEVVLNSMVYHTST